MGLEQQIVIAVGLDLLVGDPRWFPHPVKFIGQMALWLESRSRALIKWETLAGVITTIGVLLTICLVSIALLRVAAHLSGPVFEALSILMLFTAVAAKDLTRHSTAVFKALELGDLELARKKTGMMVGRRTEGLEESELIRATVESVAENMIDGVVAPLFYGLLFGPVGAIMYKAINTLDSTFGYKNERYLNFGKFPARLDDIANYVPARLGALMVPLGAALIGLSAQNSWRILHRDARRHDSPNAGWPEAAFAGALGVRFGGLNVYRNVVSVKPYIGDASQVLEACHIKKANRLMICSSVAFLIVGLAVRSLVY